MALIVEKFSENQWWRKGQVMTAEKMNGIYDKINSVIDTFNTINNKAIDGADNLFELSSQLNGTYQDDTIKVTADPNDPSIITITGTTNNKTILIPLNIAKEATDKWLDISQSMYSCTCVLIENGTSSTINNTNISLRQYNDSNKTVQNEYSGTTDTWGNLLAAINTAGTWRHTQATLRDSITGKTGICLRLAPALNLSENQYIKVQFIIVRGDYNGKTTTEVPVSTVLTKTSKDTIARDNIEALAERVDQLESHSGEQNTSIEEGESGIIITYRS